MKVVQPSSNVMPRHGLEQSDILKFIEQIGRVCYKSEDKITDGSAEKFVAGLIKRGHEAVIEHGTLIYEVSHETFSTISSAVKSGEVRDGIKFYLRFTDVYGRRIISGNVRAWRQFIGHFANVSNVVGRVAAITADYPDLFPEDMYRFSDKDVQYSRYGMTAITVNNLCYREEHLVHHDMTVKFICDRGVSHEIVRHRPASYCQESTRYCNYSNDQFGKELTFVNPTWLNHTAAGYAFWRSSCMRCEREYLYLVENGCTPQQARAVLSNCLKTELVMTAPLGEWLHFFNLRRSPAAHPDMQVSANLAFDSAVQDKTIAEILIQEVEV